MKTTEVKVNIMRTKSYTIFTLLTCLLVLSCEGIVGGDGYVHSNVDDHPLDSVIVVIYLDEKLYDSTYTDNNGFFQASEFVGCVPNCPNVKLEFKKKGYKTMRLDFQKYWKETNQSPHLEDSLRIELTKIE